MAWLGNFIPCSEGHRHPACQQLSSFHRHDTWLWSLALGAALTTSACGTTASDATDTTLISSNAIPVSAATAPAAYSDVTIPTGTSLPLALTSGIASDTSALEDAVSAELTRAITINGREVLPAGTRLTGFVTAVDD